MKRVIERKKKGPGSQDYDFEDLLLTAAGLKAEQKRRKAWVKKASAILRDVISPAQQKALEQLAIDQLAEQSRLASAELKAVQKALDLNRDEQLRAADIMAITQAHLLP